MNDQYESLFELAAILSRQNDFEEILRLVSLQASARFDAEVASIMMINPGTQHTIKTIMKEGKALDRQRYRLAEMNIVGWVTKNKQPFLSANLKTDSRFDTDTFEDETVRSAMCVPLRCGGLVIGFLLA
ncbi:MAG: GAF domain-containing protein, partial [bacterium]